MPFRILSMNGGNAGDGGDEYVNEAERARQSSKAGASPIATVLDLLGIHKQVAKSKDTATDAKSPSPGEDTTSNQSSAPVTSAADQFVQDTLSSLSAMPIEPMPGGPATEIAPIQSADPFGLRRR